MPNISVRGAVTSAMCKKAGVDACMPLGCPSFMISPHANLGMHVQKRWVGLAGKITSGQPIKIIFTVQSEANFGLYDIWISLLNNPQYTCVFVLQTPGDIPHLRVVEQRLGRPVDMKLFYSLDDWTAEYATADIILSARIHGTMVATASRTPFFLIATDFRILELANAMKIPYVMSTEVAKWKDNFQLIDLISQVNFNGSAFDSARTAAALKYVNMLNSLGLESNLDMEIVAFSRSHL